MLVLSREKNERVMIGNDVIVTIVEIRNGRVRLGIEAPDGVIVYREEIRKRRELEEDKTP